LKASAPSVEGVEARRAALRILDRVLRSGQTVDSSGYLADRLSPPDKALTLAMVGETLRRIPELDALIDSAMRLPLAGDAKARLVLRLALAQKLTMSVPDHALVATALPLVDGGPRRLVHGVLGTLLRRTLPPSDATPLPAEVEQRWEASWGKEAVAAARRQIVRRPQLDLSFADAALAERYAVEHGGTSLAPGHVRLASQSVSELPGFGEGGWWVQDLAASLPVRCIPAAAAHVLDACAAPGGKTMQLAAAGHAVVALDKSESRLGRLAENLSRTGLKAELEVADAFRWDSPRQFDAVLVDAPCTATGTFRRHPEVLHRVRDPYIRAAADAQLRLLARTADWVRPGGTLIYSVCSLERAEGEEVIASFLESSSGFRLAAPANAPAFVTPTPEGWLRILPGTLEAEGGLDGFFIACLVRGR
jgi:16S rRNA (cytosine967-C5)-methyltransferase